MSNRQLRRSLSLWRRRERYRQRKVNSAHRHNDKRAIVKWERLHNQAVRMIHKRQADIAAARPMRERAADYAETLVGIMEIGGNNIGPMVNKIIWANFGTPGEAWCGDFMAFVYRHVGSKVVNRSWASVRLLGGLFGVRRTNNPQRGDLVRFTFDHVGMFLHNNADGTITTIEGNTGLTGAVSDSFTGGDGVYKKVRPRTLVHDYLSVTR